MKRKLFIAFVLLLTLFCLASCHNEIDQGNIDTEQKILSEHSNDTFKYLLYTPENATDNMPLIVYLHGVSSKGDDISLLTSGDDLPKYFTNN